MLRDHDATTSAEAPKACRRLRRLQFWTAHLRCRAAAVPVLARRCRRRTANPHHFPGARGDGDAVRDWGRAARGGGQQLRPRTAGGATGCRASARCSIPTSRRILVAAAGPGRRLRHAARPASSSSRARAFRVFGYMHGGLADVPDDACGRSASATGDTDGAAACGDVDRARRSTAIRAKVAGRPRPRTLLVFGREPGTLRNLYASGGVGFLHDMLDVAGGDERLRRRRSASRCRPRSETLLARAPEVIIELHVETDGPRRTSTPGRRRAGDSRRPQPSRHRADRHRAGDGRTARREGHRTDCASVASGGVLRVGPNSAAEARTRVAPDADCHRAIAPRDCIRAMYPDASSA